MNNSSRRGWATARAAVLLAAGLYSVPGVSAQPIAAADPFIQDAVIGFNARTFFMDVEDNSKPPSGTQKEAWALGGKLFGRTGYWNKMLQLGASYYLSAPLYAPDDKDGTLLLAPGQRPDDPAVGTRARGRRHSVGCRAGPAGRPACADDRGRDYASSLTSLVVPFAFTLAIPASRDDSSEYIWLVPMTW